MRRLYSLLMVLLAPAAFAVVLCRGLRDRSYWRNLGERFGWGRTARDSPSIWLHAVSLGEVAAAAALVRALRDRYPDIPFVLTTATPTGRAKAHALFGDEIDIRFLPYDTPGSVRRFRAGSTRTGYGATQNLPCARSPRRRSGCGRTALWAQA